MKYIAITCAERQHYIGYLKARIPMLKIAFDDFTDAKQFSSTAFFNHQKAWSMAGNEAAVIMEDDILLCDSFTDIIESVIADRPSDVIQFFSMRKKDLTEGSRYEPGRTFMMCQCFYLPAGTASELYEFSIDYAETSKDRTCPSDPCIAAFLKSKKLKYWIHCPNLVDHRVGKSLLGPRSSKRQSKTFQL